MLGHVPCHRQYHSNSATFSNKSESQYAFACGLITVYPLLSYGIVPEVTSHLITQMLWPGSGDLSHVFNAKRIQPDVCSFPGLFTAWMTIPAIPCHSLSVRDHNTNRAWLVQIRCALNLNISVERQLLDSNASPGLQGNSKFHTLPHQW